MSLIAQDPRIDPRLKAMFGQFPSTILPDVPDRETLLVSVSGGLGDLAAAPKPDPALYEAIAPSTGLRIHTKVVTSQPDGNTINLQIIIPEGDGPFACVYYIHGGGMMMGSCFDPNYAAFGRLIAANGVAVVMVDFRNALFPCSVAEVAPYPAGLNDCQSSLKWVSGHAAELNVDPARIVIAGESGGANLALAVALRLNRAGEIGMIKGIYVMCPYLAGEWTTDPASSAHQNAGILMDTRSNYGAMAYGIDALLARDPLAWPAFASEADVAGLPPVIIAVNECDPLRDDGVDFYRLLLRAGVRARCRQLMGTVHGTEVYVLPCPEISRDAAREIARFCAD